MLRVGRQINQRAETEDLASVRLIAVDWEQSGLPDPLWFVVVDRPRCA